MLKLLLLRKGKNARNKNKSDTNEKVATLIEDYKIVERYIIKNQDNIEGNIYSGIIKNIVPGIKAAFIDIG